MSTTKYYIGQLCRAADCKIQCLKKVIIYCHTYRSTGKVLLQTVGRWVSCGTLLHGSFLERVAEDPS